MDSIGSGDSTSRVPAVGGSDASVTSSRSGRCEGRLARARGAAPKSSVNPVIVSGAHVVTGAARQSTVDNEPAQPTSRESTALQTRRDQRAARDGYDPVRPSIERRTLTREERSTRCSGWLTLASSSACRAW